MTAKGTGGAMTAVSESHDKKRKKRFVSIRVKLIFVYVVTSILVFSIHLVLYNQVNQTVDKIDQLYVSNISLNELSDSLEAVQGNLFEYLSTKSTDALNDYYRSEQDYVALTDQLTESVTNNEMLLLEKNIRAMSESYLTVADKTIQDKRGQNVEKYKKGYAEAEQSFAYINDYIYTLNNMQFQINSDNYHVLISSLQYLEISSSVVLLTIAAINIFIIVVWTGSVIRPLVRLAQTANEVAAGNMDAKVPGPTANDEIGVVTHAFDDMLLSIRNSIQQVKNSMEMERVMKEKELLMETHLKDAQLRYLQAQINPHFLFNSLNAGAQLAMMEGAERTCLFVEKMADFFRYNIKKDNEITTIEDEVQVVENYIYILNVRFSDEIIYRKKIDKKLLSSLIPGMVLQPIVENAIKHGLRDLERPGKITLTISKENETVLIRVHDNGRGMSPEKIAEVMQCATIPGETGSYSMGIGMTNVISRLRLYYDRVDVFEIRSLGVDKGTEVLVRIPANFESGRALLPGGDRSDSSDSSTGDSDIGDSDIGDSSIGDRENKGDSKRV